MNRTLYIVFILLWACNSGVEHEELRNADAAEIQESSVSMEDTAISEADFTKMSSEKLQEYADLLMLETQHPQFKDQIRQQLLNISETNLLQTTHSDSLQVLRMRQLGNAERVSDYLDRIHYAYTLSAGNTLVQDTLVARIAKQYVLIDDRETISYKITFERIEPEN